MIGKKISQTIEECGAHAEGKQISLTRQANSFKAQTDKLIREDKERQRQMFIARMHQAI